MAVPYEFVKNYVSGMDEHLFGMYSKAVSERRELEDRSVVNHLITTISSEIRDMIKAGNLTKAAETMAEVTKHDKGMCMRAAKTFRSSLDGFQENDPLD